MRRTALALLAITAALAGTAEAAGVTFGCDGTIQTPNQIQTGLLRFDNFTPDPTNSNIFDFNTSYYSKTFNGQPFQNAAGSGAGTFDTINGEFRVFIDSFYSTPPPGTLDFIEQILGFGPGSTAQAIRGRTLQIGPQLTFSDAVLNVRNCKVLTDP